MLVTPRHFARVIGVTLLALAAIVALGVGGCSSTTSTSAAAEAAPCGNGVMDPGEACDTALTPGSEGACPATCDDGNACTADSVTSVGDCAASCASTPVTDCVSGDGCCPSGCSHADDADCVGAGGASCGNGKVDPGEACDTALSSGVGVCPKSCNDGDACTADALVGGGTCGAHCTVTLISKCAGGDGCCPAGCTHATDPDCADSPTTCGNGVVDGTEVCDTKIPVGSAGACPTSCDDQSPCTTDTLQGAGSCAAVCVHTSVPGCTSGDGCTGSNFAAPLVFDAGGVAHAAGTTVGLADDASPGACGATTASSDAVYTFTLVSKADVTIRVTPRNGTSFKPVAYLRTACNGIDLACAKSTALSPLALLSKPGLGAGAYYLWVDGNGAAGDYAIDVVQTAPAPYGDQCSGARPLHFFADGAGSVALDSGDTAGATNNDQSFCGSGTGKDLVYSFTTTSWFDFSASAVGAASQRTVYLKTACNQGEDLLCASATGSGASATMSVGSLPPGTYFLFVEGSASPPTSEPYWLIARLTPPAANPSGDTCAAPKPLAWSAVTTGQAHEEGYSAKGFHNDGAGAILGSTCGDSSGTDFVYVFATTSVRHFTATLKEATNEHVLYLRQGCRYGAKEVACTSAAAGANASIDSAALPAGVYYLWVSETNLGSGYWYLDATLQ